MHGERPDGGLDERSREGPEAPPRGDGQDRSAGPDGAIVPVVLVILAAVVTVVIIFGALTLFQTVKEPGDERVRVSFILDDGTHANFSCEVADNHFERVQGLQHREDLAEGSGMLFVFEEPTQVYFIMPNMNFPLDIIFIDGNGTVLNVEEAEPEEPGTDSSEYTRYLSDGKAKWVVEINQGLSQEYGIGPGTRFVHEEAP